MKGWQSGKRHYALGRLKKGAMNATEARYAKHLDQLLLAGEILWYKFEGIKLKLADNCHLTIDFPVMEKDSTLTLYDVKGARAVFSDDARVKMRMAASSYPFRIVAVYPVKGGGWEEEEF